jgi:hypothetical protein
MPPKPMELMKGSGVEFYNIDFSLQNQLRLAGASVPQSLQDQVPVIIFSRILKLLARVYLCADLR